MSAELLQRKILLNSGAVTRKEKLEGRDYIVAPAAMMEEGVWIGNKGGVLYPESELESACPSWNHKPIVVNHPQDKDGKFISACQPNVLNTRKVGIVLNTQYEGKQRTECWFDVERCKQVDARVLKRLETNQKLEGSVGIIADTEQTEGIFNGKNYIGIARNHRPDHFAVLPDLEGAYSIKDGGGILTVNMAPEPERLEKLLQASAMKAIERSGMLTNEMSFNAVTRQLGDLLSEKYGKPGKYWDGYVVDVYPDNVLFSNLGEPGCRDKMWMHKYTTKDDEVKLDGDAVEVERKVEYRKVGGAAVIGNSTQQTQQGVLNMAFDRKVHLDSLIGHGWAEEDRTELDKMSDNALQKCKPEAPNPTPPGVTTNAAAAKSGPAEPSMAEIVAKATGAAAAAAQPEQKQADFATLLANADPATRAQFEDMARCTAQWKGFEGQQKEKFVTQIVANSRNKFSKEFLMQKPLEELQGLAALSGTAPQQTQAAAPAPMFQFAAGVEEPLLNAKMPEPLIPPRSHDVPAAAGAAK